VILFNFILLFEIIKFELISYTLAITL